MSAADPTIRLTVDRAAAARDSSEVNVIVVPTDPDRSLLASGSFWDLGVPMEAAESEVAALAAAQVERAEQQRPYV